MGKLVLFMALAVAVPSQLMAQVTIGAPGGSEVRTWGVENTQMYGQTFTTPAANILNSFSFWLGRASPLSATTTPSINFRAFVFAWDASLNTATGSALFTSSIMTHNADGSTPFTRYDFATGNLTLSAGGTYVMFLQVTSGSGGVFWESTVGNEYTGGDFVYNNTTDPNSGWEGPGFPTATDLRFEAEFSAVPEPSTWILLATGLVGIAAVVRRREKVGAGEA